MTRWIYTRSHNWRPLKTLSITMVPTVRFGYPKFAKMIRRCDWWMSVFSLIFNFVTETWLFSALHQTSARGLKCNIKHPITQLLPIFSTCILWTSSKLRSKSAYPITGAASRISKTWPWQVQPACVRPSPSSTKPPLKVISEHVKAPCLTWQAHRSGWVLLIPLSWSSMLLTM
jgi:hypothetical protein